MVEPPALPKSWLERIQFPLGDPFSTREATAEPESTLLEYFVRPPGFEALYEEALSRRSGIYTARRGGGKTTLRRFIAWQCRSGRAGQPILAVTYTDFAEPLRHADEAGGVAATHHVRAIVRAGMPALFDALAERPARGDRFTGGIALTLRDYLVRFSDLLTERGMDWWLAGRGLLDDQVNAAALARGAVPAGAPFLRFAARLMALPPEPWDTTGETELSLLKGFVELARRAGFEAVFVLVDGVDEREPMASDPEQAAALLHDLLANLNLMELAGVTFKVFCPSEVYEALRRRGFRDDRLLPRSIEWTPDELEVLLDRRVRVFSRGALDSLDAVAEGGHLVEEMAQAAQGTPRNMLLLAGWLLYWHRRRTAGEVDAPADFLLTDEDLARALESFGAGRTAAPLPPPDEPPAAPSPSQPVIRVDEAGRAWHGRRQVALPPDQLRLLICLLENEGRVVTVDEIGYAVHGDDWAATRYPEAIDKAVQRLRKRLGLGRAGPRIIRKVSAKEGYVLVQPDSVEELEDNKS